MSTETLNQEIEAAVEQVAAEIDKETEEKETEIKEVASDTTTEEVADVAEKTEETEEVDDKVAGEEAGEEANDVVPPEDGADDEPPVPELSDEILARAISAGMTLTDAISFPSESALNRVVTAAEQAAKPADQKDDDAGDQFTELKLDPEKYEPEVIEMMDRVNEVLRNQHEQIQDFKRIQEETTQANLIVAAQEMEAWFDKQIEGLGKDFTDTLGSGRYSSLDRGSSQFAKREQIAEQMSIQIAGYQAQGLEAPSREQMFDTAARLVLADKYQELHEQRLASDLKKRSGQHIQRAGGSQNVSTQTPEEEVAQALKEKFGI